MDEAVQLLAAVDVTLVIIHQTHVVLRIREAARQLVRIRTHVRQVLQIRLTEAAAIPIIEEAILVRLLQEAQVLTHALPLRVGQLTRDLRLVAILHREVRIIAVTQRRIEVRRKAEATHHRAVAVSRSQGLTPHLHGQAVRARAEVLRDQAAEVRRRGLQEGRGDR